jgi:hypothetical protein
MSNSTFSENFFRFQLFPNAPKTKLYHPDVTNMPSRLRYGDLDKDGFEDLLITV